MLLLLALLKITNWKMKDLFEIRQGVTTTKLPPKGEYRYKVINLGNIGREWDDTSLNDYYSDKPLKADRILSERDYLISCKGVVKGVSMLTLKKQIEELKANGSGLVASSHFFVLTPKEPLPIPIDREEVAFLHNMITYFLKDMDVIASGRGSARYINKADVEGFEIEFVQDAESKMPEFQTILKNYNHHLSGLKNAEKDMMQFNESMFWAAGARSQSFSGVSGLKQPGSAPLKFTSANYFINPGSMNHKVLSEVSRSKEMAAEKEKLAQLTSILRENKFSFLPKGEISLQQIYEEVKRMYPHLVNEEYTCSMNCNSQIKTGEYQHKIRTLLQGLKNDVFEYDKNRRGYWVKK